MDSDRAVKRGPGNFPSILWFCRGLFMFLGLSIYIWYSDIQKCVDNSWEFLRELWVFNSVYFETWWAVVTYALILAWPYAFSKMSYSKQYQIDPAMTWHSAGAKKILMESVVYCMPLMTLDTFAVKKYCGVSDDLLSIQRKSWIQYNRLLPVDPPTVFQIIWHLVVSLVLYDVGFYIIHFTVHKNMWLYKHIHATHHEHGVLHSRVTNQLSVSERIILILSANQALKIVKAHPMTRALFVPIFVMWLVDNHCGYDLPWGLDKIVPFRLVGGSRYHYEHHMKGSRNYQPFFTYIDRFVNRKSKSL